MTRVIDKAFFLLAVLTMSTALNAQEHHFVMYQHSALDLNPANTGLTESSFRVANLYREQWRAFGSPFITNGLSIDFKVPQGKNTMGLGLLYLYDESGDINYIRNKVFLSFAYHLHAGDHIFGFGLQGGLVNRSINNAALTFPDQYDQSTGFFNPNMGSSDVTLGQRNTYPDFNFGLNWRNMANKWQPSLGFSLAHLSRPDIGFGARLARLSMRYTFNGEARIPFLGTYFIKPAFRYTQLSGASQINVGSKLGLVVNQGSKGLNGVYTGLFFRTGFGRNSDAISPLLGIEFSGFKIAAAYDLTISDFKSANDGKGGFELSIVYSPLKHLKINKKPSCERM